MTEDNVQDRDSDGPNNRPVNDTIPGTGPGIPDEALSPGEELREPPSNEEVERAAKALGASPGAASQVNPWWRKPGVAAAAGIGSAAIVAALLYAGSRNRRS
jgi:hypothetical protein